MRAVIDVARDPEGRLVGELDCPGAGSRPFSGLMELVGLIEDGLQFDRAGPGGPGAADRS